MVKKYIIIYDLDLIILVCNVRDISVSLIWLMDFVIDTSISITNWTRSPLHIYIYPSIKNLGYKVSMFLGDV